MLNMRLLLPIIFVFVPSFASREYMPLQNLPENEKSILIELVKRLEKDNDYERGWRDQAQPSSQCAVSTDMSSIIKRIDSENNGAKFLTLHEDIETNDACSDQCCKNKSCDLAVYENKGHHHCYLFQCEGKCLFGHHSSYISNSIVHRPGQQPTAGTKLDVDLIDLDQDSDTVGSRTKEASVQPTTPNSTTPAPSPFIRAHSVGLEGPFCQRDLHCEDPNAVCNYHKCRCREGYYQKGHICRQNCPPSNFGCLELGTLGRGPECVPRSQVCDSIMQCADGSDEFNCPESDSHYKPQGVPDKNDKSTLQEEDTDRLGANSHVAEKPETPAKQLSQVSEPSRHVSTSDNKGKSTAQHASSSTHNTQTKSHSKPSEKAKESHPKPTPAQDKLAETKPPADNIDDGFPASKGVSDLAKESSKDQPPAFDGKSSSSSGDPKNLIERQNSFISKLKLEEPKEVANMQGPIIALSLGLAFTVILLVFVACRLRTVRRRLRKGRPLHSNEADYLINGMYL